mgnify:CR=1 FL=1
MDAAALLTDKEGGEAFLSLDEVVTRVLSELPTYRLRENKGHNLPRVLSYPVSESIDDLG